MTRTIQTFIIDSFTDTPFKGNPAGVCWLPANMDAPLADGDMQNIALELGLSETAFVSSMRDGEFSIRYFSPKMEIPLCGHATLAAAKALSVSGRTGESMTFITGDGRVLTARVKGEIIEMDFPVFDSVPAPVPDAMCAALGIGAPVTSGFCDGIKSLLIEIEDVEVLRGLSPDYAALVPSHDGIDGACITAKSDRAAYDFESRYFWPWSGTDEDPVTGAAHSMLAPFWHKKLGKTQMRAFQCSSRGGFMGLDLTPNKGLIISSQAQLIFKGELYI